MAIKQEKRELDARERRFVGEYLIDLDPNRAAVAAGYSKTMASTKAYQWVSDGKRKPHVYEAVKRAMQKRENRTEITQDKVLKEMAKLGFSDIRKALKWGPGLGTIDTDAGQIMTNGVLLVDSDELDDDTAASVAEIAQTAQGIKIKLHDKRAALVDIGRHLGMFNDKLALTGDLTITEIKRTIIG